MLDVKAATSNGQPKIARIGIKRSGEEGGGKIVDLDLAEEITDEEEAAVIDELVPGAARLWRSSKAAQDAESVETELNGAAAGAAAGSLKSGGPFGQYSVPVKDDGARFVLGEGDRIVEAKACEVVSLKVKATPKTCIYTVKLQIHGLGIPEISQLIEWFDSLVHVSSERRQPLLPFRQRTPGQIGEVVSGIDEGIEYAGIIVGRGNSDDGETIEVDDLGHRYIVPAATISGSFAVAEEARDAMLDRYVTTAKKRRVKPSWTHLVAALGRAYLTADGAPGKPWALTNEIVADALDATLPPEATATA